MRIEAELSHTANREFVGELLLEHGTDGLAARYRDANESDDLVAALGADAAAVSEILEKLAIDPDSGGKLWRLMDFATCLRVRAGGPALRGAPLKWEEHRPDHWDGRDAEGTSWYVAPGTWGIGLTISSWDRPDWWLTSIEEAKVFAAEVVARPKFPRETWVEEKLVGDD